MPFISVLTNLPADKFSDPSKAVALCEKVAEKFEVKKEDVALSFQTDIKVFYKGSSDPFMAVDVAAVPSRFSPEKVKLAFELITAKCVEDFPEVKPERVVVVLQKLDTELCAVGGKSLKEWGL